MDTQEQVDLLDSQVRDLHVGVKQVTEDGPFSIDSSVVLNALRELSLEDLINAFSQIIKRDYGECFESKVHIKFSDRPSDLDLDTLVHMLKSLTLTDYFSVLAHIYQRDVKPSAPQQRDV